MKSHPRTKTTNASPAFSAGPFALADDDAYWRWRDAKLAPYPRRSDALIVEVKNPLRPTAAEVEELQRICHVTNMAVYATSPAGADDKAIPRRLGASLGLVRLDTNLLADDDGISSLALTPGKSERGYIPYSNKRMSWHTDGYYNTAAARIRAFILHCVQTAAVGGDNQLLDHEIAYILMRDANPDFIRALSVENVMTIPPNTDEGGEIRPAQTGPVFSVDAESGRLHMRYTARTRSIEWLDDAATRAAVQFLEQLLAGECEYIFNIRLAAGQGLVCNNVLHNRSAFENDGAQRQERLIYRARYHDRIAGTALDTDYHERSDRHEIHSA